MWQQAAGISNHWNPYGDKAPPKKALWRPSPPWWVAFEVEDRSCLRKSRAHFGLINAGGIRRGNQYSPAQQGPEARRCIVQCLLPRQHWQIPILPKKGSPTHKGITWHGHNVQRYTQTLDYVARRENPPRTCLLWSSLIAPISSFQSNPQISLHRLPHWDGVWWWRGHRMLS